MAINSWLSLGLTKPLPEALEREVNIERLHLLSRHTPIAAIAFSLNTLIVIVAIWDHSSHVALIGWLTTFQTISFLQLRSWLRHRNKPRPTFVPPRIIVRSVGHAVFLGALLGVFAATNFPAGNISEQLIVGFVVIGTAAGSVVALYPVPAAAYSFILLCLLPPLAIAVSFGERFYYYIVALAVVFIAFLLLSVRRAYISFVDAMERKLENIELANQAQAANRAKSMFLAKMSHELRTPLNAIIGFSDIMANEMLGPIGIPQYTDYLKDIKKSGAHLLVLIQNILDVSKVESGSFDLDEENVDVGAIVKFVLSQHAARVSEAKLKLETDIADPSPRVHADARRLEQIISNLLDNAIKFTPAGGTVTLSVGLGDSGGLELAIADTGIGIADENLTRTQAAFGQTDTLSSDDGDTDDSFVARDGEGAGLGLTLARALTEAHGGTLSIDSVPGAGTKVRVALPSERTLAAKHVFTDVG